MTHDQLDDGLLHPADQTAAPAGSGFAAEPEIDSETGDAGETEDPKLHFPTVYAFVADFLVHVYPRQLRDQDNAYKWCPRWFLHPGALSRLEALWKAFEALRLEPGVAASTWWNEHADPCMTVLTDPAGPFARCGPGKHQQSPPLPVEDPPAWLLTEPGSTTWKQETT